MIMTCIPFMLLWGAIVQLPGLTMGYYIDLKIELYGPFIINACSIYIYLLWHKRYDKIIKLHDKYDNRKYRYIAILSIVIPLIFIILMAYAWWYHNNALYEAMRN